MTRKQRDAEKYLARMQADAEHGRFDFPGRSGSPFRFSSGKRMRPGRELIYFVVAGALVGGVMWLVSLLFR